MADIETPSFIARSFPLSYGQKSLWLMHQALPNSSAYHIALAVRIRAPLNIASLRGALQTLLNRHAALRTVFSAGPDGELLQHVYAYRPLSFEQIDISGWSEADLREKVAAAHRRPFDLAAGPLMRADLFTDGCQRHVLLLTVHHIVFDGQSMFALLTELQQNYAASESEDAISRRPAKHMYHEFVEWQSGMLGGPDGRRHQDYWRAKLEGAPHILDIPTDHPRPAHISARGGSLVFGLAPELIERLKLLAKKEGVHLYEILLAAYHVLLHRYSGQRDILTGFLTAGRTQLRFAKVCGFFTNPIVLRNVFSSGPAFLGFLKEQHGSLTESLEHQDFPFPALVEHARINRVSGYMPLVQVLFNFFKVPRTARFDELFLTGHEGEAVCSPGLEMESFGLNQDEGEFDLVLEAAEGRRFWCRFKYRADLFEHDTIARLAGHYQNLLHGIAADPDRKLSDLPLLNEAERRQMLVAWNETAVEYPRDACVHHLFEAQAARTPDAIALVSEDRQLTYAQLNCQANALAHYLRQRGAGPDVLVGLCVERSMNMMIGLLGILKAGGAYVPLDPHFPKARLDLIVEDAQPKILLTERGLLHLVSSPDSAVLLDAERPAYDSGPAGNPQGRVTGTNLAYVLYTSGSTGKPKGVAIPHSAFTNFLISMRQRPGLTERDVLLAVTTISFDIAGLELFLPLTCGARVVITGKDRVLDGTQLGDALRKHRVTVMQATPATWRLLIDSGWTGEPGLKALCGGEALSRELANELLERVGSLWNMYGPTETTVWSTVHQVEPGDDPIPIGAPIANTTLYILDDHLQPVPIGVTGELHIGGAGVARGYLNRPVLTAERFIADPFGGGEGARLYKTGDGARYRADGSIAFLGRLDDQVKIRGHRIELAEIEGTLLRHPSVREAAVIVHEEPPGAKRLVAYLTGHPGNAPAPPRDLRDSLARELPDYMVPALFVYLDALPLTPNNKLDRKTLRSIPLPSRELAHESARPRTSTEIAVANLWTEILGVPQIGVDERFDDAGGDSLSFARMILRLRARFGVELPVTMDSGSMTVAGLAAAIERARGEDRRPANAEVSPRGPRPTFTPAASQNGRVRQILVSGGGTLLRALARVECTGIENVPPTGPFIIAGNHISFFDSLIFGSVFGDRRNGLELRPTFIIADKWRRWVHWYATRFGDPIYIRRGEGDLDALADATAVLKAKGVVAIMPEGKPTRGALIRCKPGIAYLAADAGAPVLPIAIYGHEGALGSWRRLRRVGVRISIGPSFHLPGSARSHSEYQRHADTVMRAIAGLMPAEYHGAYSNVASKGAAV